VSTCISTLFCSHGWDPERDVLFVGERGLFPHSPWYNTSTWPLEGDYRFVNSGLYAGSFTALAEFLRDALDAAVLIKTVDDQEVANYLFMHTHWRTRLHLDRRHQCIGSGFSHNSEYSLESGRWVQTKLGGTPGAVHFNSKAAKTGVMVESQSRMPAFRTAWGEPLLDAGRITLVGNTPSTSQTQRMVDLCRPAQEGGYKG